MMTMKRHPTRPTGVAVRSEVFELDDRASFLDLLARACARNGRYTLTVEANEVVYTVLVDRGGPFNATGGGATGSPALVRAGQLRRGRCSLTEGWPVDQPMYQPGLDLTLQALLNGVVEPVALPRPRGVDSMRNAEFEDRRAVASASPEAYVRPLEVPSETERLIASLPRPVAPVAPAAAAASAPTPTPTPAAPRPVAAALPVAVTAEDPGVAAPPDPAIGEAANRLATRALLWMVEVKGSSEEYTLRQAASLAGQGLVEGIGEMVHPLRQGLGARVQRIRSEWKRSGEVAAKSSGKANARRLTVIGDFDPDGEFRLSGRR
ncbi:MAG: hypothetical protein NVS3B24_18160 [Candidatus Dormibacteria bacterium]